MSIDVCGERQSHKLPARWVAECKKLNKHLLSQYGLEVAQYRLRRRKMIQKSQRWKRENVKRVVFD